MTHLLDTNSCVDLATGPDSHITARLMAAAPGNVVLCSVVVAELLYGAHRSARKSETLNGFPTVFDSLLASQQKAADYNRDDNVPPAAVLWPDEKREWESLVPRLRSALPQFLILGPYDAAHRSGPAIWLRCVLAGKIAGVKLPTGTVPIIYLPGVSRATLRATEDCPPG